MAFSKLFAMVNCRIRFQRKRYHHCFRHDRHGYQREILRSRAVASRSVQNAERGKMLLHKAQVYQYLSGDADIERITFEKAEKRNERHLLAYGILLYAR